MGSPPAWDGSVCHPTAWAGFLPLCAARNCLSGLGEPGGCSPQPFIFPWGGRRLSDVLHTSHWPALPYTLPLGQAPLSFTVPPAKPSPTIPSVGTKPQPWLSPAFTSSQQGPGIGDLPVLHTASPQHQRNCSWLRFFCLGRFSWLCPQILALLGFAPGNPEPTGRIYSSTPSSRNAEMPCKTLSWEGSGL